MESQQTTLGNTFFTVWQRYGLAEYSPFTDMEALSKLEQLEKIHRVSRILDQHEIRHWIDFGTLLGAVREKGMIQDDVDVDFDFMNEDRNKLLKLSESILMATGMKLVDGEIIRCCPEHTRLKGVNEHVAAELCVKLGLLYVDFYPCKMAGTNVLHVLPPFSFKAHFIDQLEEIELDGFLFPCPRHRKELCINRYGLNWETPVDHETYKRNEFAYIAPLKNRTHALVYASSKTRSTNLLTLLQRASAVFDTLALLEFTDDFTETVDWQHTVPPPKHPCFPQIKDLIVEIIITSKKSITANDMISNGIDYLVTNRQDAEALQAIAPDPIERDLLHII